MTRLTLREQRQLRAHGGWRRWVFQDQLYKQNREKCERIWLHFLLQWQTGEEHKCFYTAECQIGTLLFWNHLHILPCSIWGKEGGSVCFLKSWIAHWRRYIKKDVTNVAKHNRQTERGSSSGQIWWRNAVWTRILVLPRHTWLWQNLFLLIAQLIIQLPKTHNFMHSHISIFDHSHTVCKDIQLYINIMW